MATKGSWILGLNKCTLFQKCLYWNETIIWTSTNINEIPSSRWQYRHRDLSTRHNLTLEKTFFHPLKYKTRPQLRTFWESLQIVNLSYAWAWSLMFKNSSKLWSKWDQASPQAQKSAVSTSNTEAYPFKLIFSPSFWRCGNTNKFLKKWKMQSS